MRTFTLCFEGNLAAEPKTLHFEGADPYEVFTILEREGMHHHVTIWDGETRLATLTRIEQGSWRLG